MNKVLTKAIELLEKYDWAQKTYARDARGEPVNTWSPEACSFCALGFLGRARFELMADEGYPGSIYTEEHLVEDLIPKEFHSNIPAYNDHPFTTKQDIIDLFRKANESSIP